MGKRKLKEMLCSGELLVGLWVRSNCSDFIEIVGLSCFNFVYLDREHTTVNWEKLKELVITADLADLPVLLRVEKNDHVIIRKAIEIGIQGILVPFIRTRNDAIKAVQAAKFPPMGMRGIDRGVRSSKFLVEDYSDYIKRSNEETVVCFMIEHKDAVDNLDGILSVEGLDCVCFGPSDYSASIGMPGQYNQPKVREAEERVISKAREKGVYLLRTATTLETAKSFAERGVRFFILGSDMGIFQQGCKDIIEKIVKKLK